MAPPQRREDALTFGVRGQESNSELNPAAASLSATASPAPINEHVRCRWSRRIVSWRRCANWEDAVFDQPGTIWHPPPDMDLVCPLCRSAIAIDDINVATDIALCRRCSKTFSFSELIGASAGAAPDLTAPPAALGSSRWRTASAPALRHVLGWPSTWCHLLARGRAYRWVASMGSRSLPDTSILHRRSSDCRS